MAQGKGSRKRTKLRRQAAKRAAKDSRQGNVGIS